jgi:osmotically-inducible protein OsmY
MSDSMIRKKLMAQFKSEQWSKHALLNATVQDGTVKLWGIVDSEAEKEAARVAAEQVAGVRAFENNVIVQPAVDGA